MKRASGRRVDRAAQQQLPGIAGEVALGEPALPGSWNVELGRQLGALGAFAHHAGVAAAAEQELERIDQDRLAGAGLAGEHGEAGAELERGALDR